MHYGTAVQVDGSMRYLYTCPRGTIAIDVNGSRAELWHCLNGGRLTPRDDRDAWASHRMVREEESEA